MITKQNIGSNMITLNSFSNFFSPVHQVRPRMILGPIKLGVKVSCARNTAPLIT